MSERPKFVKKIIERPSFEGELKEVPHVTSLDKAIRKEIRGVILGKPVDPEPEEGREENSSDTA